MYRTYILHLNRGCTKINFLYSELSEVESEKNMKFEMRLNELIKKKFNKKKKIKARQRAYYYFFH